MSVPDGVETDWGARTDGTVGYGTSASGSLNQPNGVQTGYVTVSTNGYPSNAPLSDLQLCYAQGYVSQMSVTPIPLG